MSSNNRSVQKRTLPTKQLLSVKEGLQTKPCDFGLLLSSRQQLRYGIAGYGDGKGLRVARYANLNWRSYFLSFNWVVLPLKKTEAELIEEMCSG